MELLAVMSKFYSEKNTSNCSEQGASIMCSASVAASDTEDFVELKMDLVKSSKLWK